LIRIQVWIHGLLHYLFVPLTLGLVISTACMETAFVWTRDGAWRLAAHFWFRLFALGWLVGIVTGYPLRAQLLSDWETIPLSSSPCSTSVAHRGGARAGDARRGRHACAVG